MHPPTLILEWHSSAKRYRLSSRGRYGGDYADVYAMEVCEFDVMGMDRWLLVKEWDVKNDEPVLKPLIDAIQLLRRGV